MTKDESAALVEKLRRNAAEAGECEICPELVSDAADYIDALEAALAEARAGLTAASCDCEEQSEFCDDLECGWNAKTTLTKIASLLGEPE